MASVVTTGHQGGPDRNRDLGGLVAQVGGQVEAEPVLPAQREQLWEHDDGVADDCAQLGDGVSTAGLAVRIGFEERALLDCLGERYLRFAADRRRLIPGLW
ncbi:MAG: hypothetical protein QOF20_3287 [Acidimicrobiaceae bacterium]|nr:hypothetical protein [Acidimicrobiaceae bacterium]